jgi:hypothetical protein
VHCGIYVNEALQTTHQRVGSFTQAEHLLNSIQESPVIHVFKKHYQVFTLTEPDWSKRDLF